jgi:two-component system, chemotaxis family, response regulator Rcp1
MTGREAPGRAFDILLVDDSDDDIFLMRKALEGVKKPYRLHTVNDGEQALNFLRRNVPYNDAPRPDVIFLDLYMPGKSGSSEVLSEIKNDLGLKAIPVIVMTTSDIEDDIRMCYEFHANSYIVKPPDLRDLYLTVGNIVNYWFSTVKLPPRAQHEEVESERTGDRR